MTSSTNSPEMILEVLRRRGRAIAKEIAPEIGIDDTNVRRHLKRLRDQGMVDFVYEADKKIWSLCDPIAGGEIEAVQISTSESESDRVKLARELLDLEQKMAALNERHAEILRLLS